MQPRVFSRLSAVPAFFFVSMLLSKMAPTFEYFREKMLEAKTLKYIASVLVALLVCTTSISVSAANEAERETLARLITETEYLKRLVEEGSISQDPRDRRPINWASILNDLQTIEQNLRLALQGQEGVQVGRPRKHLEGEY
jgi:hypothetical protein